MKKPNPFAKGKPAKGINPFAKSKKYAAGGLAEIGDVDEGKPEGGRFSEDTYARARAFAKAAEREEPQPATKAKSAPKPAPKAEPKEEIMSERKPGTGSGRGGQGGPTAAELATAGKRKQLDEFRASVKRGVDAYGTGDTSEGPLFMPGPAANRAMVGTARLGSAAKAARPALPAPSAPSGPALPSPRMAPSSPRVGTNPAPKALPKPREQATTWKSRESAIADVAKKRAAAAKGRPAPKTKGDDIKAKSRFKDDEAGMEFKCGGKVQARTKKARYI